MGNYYLIGAYFVLNLWKKLLSTKRNINAWCQLLSTFCSVRNSKKELSIMKPKEWAIVLATENPGRLPSRNGILSIEFFSSEVEEERGFSEWHTWEDQEPCLLSLCRWGRFFSLSVGTVLFSLLLWEPPGSHEHMQKALRGSRMCDCWEHVLHWNYSINLTLLFATDT